MEELDISRVRLTIVLPLLRAAGWDVFDISQVAPDYRTGSGTVDFTLTPTSIRVGRRPASPQVVVWVKPYGEDPGRRGNERRIIAQCVRAGAPLGVLTNGRRWLLFPVSESSDNNDHRFCEIDLLEDPDAAAENLNRHLSRGRVASGQAARSTEQQGAQPVPVPGRDVQRQQAKGGKVGVHSPTRPGLDPAESQVGEVVGRINVQRIDPSVGKNPDYNKDAHQAERDANDRQRSGIHLLPCSHWNGRPDGQRRSQWQREGAGQR